MKKATFDDRLLRVREVLEILPISRSTLYEGMAIGLYPAPVKLGKRTVAWRESEIRAIIDPKSSSPSQR